MAGDPRNYILDHHVVTADCVPGVAKAYVVMQFERPIVFVALSIGDHTGGVGGSSRFDLLVGADLASAAARPECGHRPDLIWPPDLLDDGGFFHFVGIGKGVWSRSVSSRYPRFNFAVLRLDPAGATVGFDNLIVVKAVPQPGALALLLAGLGALAATGVTQRQGRIPSRARADFASDGGAPRLLLAARTPLADGRGWLLAGA